MNKTSEQNECGEANQGIMLDFLTRIQQKVFVDKQALAQELASSRGHEKMIFTNGCFDILHRGHVEYLAQARMLGDYLVVGLNSDASISRIKGKNRPLQKWPERASVLAGMESIDYIIVMPEDTPVDLLLFLTPAIHCKGGDYEISSLPESSTVASYGGSVKILPFVDNFSTTQLIEKIRSF